MSMPELVNQNKDILQKSGRLFLQLIPIPKPQYPGHVDLRTQSHKSVALLDENRCQCTCHRENIAGMSKRCNPAFSDERLA